MDLLDEWLQEDPDWDGGDLLEEVYQVPDDEFSHSDILMVLNQREGNGFIDNRGVVRSLQHEVIKDLKKQS